MPLNIFKRALSLLLLCALLAALFVPFGVNVYATEAATLNGVGYDTLKQALDAASDGDNIYLISDIKVDDTLVINKSVNLYANSSVSVERASGFDSAVFNIASGTFSISSGITIDGKGDSVSSSLVIVTGGTFIMNTGTRIVNNNTVSDDQAAVKVNAGTFDFRGGSVADNSSSGYGDAVYLSSSGKLRISGSASFGAGSAIYLGNSAAMTVSSNLDAAGTDITVYADDMYDTRRIADISGGTLDAAQIARFKIVGTDPDAYSVISIGQTLVAHKDDSAPVIKSAVEYNGFKYDTFNDALANAYEEYVTLYLLKDITIDHNTVIKGDRKVTIIPKNSAVITRFSGYTDTLFTVEQGSSLTLGGAMQINGSAVASNGAAFTVGGELVLKSSLIISNHSNSTSLISVEGGALSLDGASVSGNKASNGIVSITSGSFVMNSGSIKSNTTVNGGAVYLKGGKFTMNGGEISSNSAYLGGGVYIGDGSFDMQGGKIYSNTATQGSCVWSAGSFTLGGNATLLSSDNTKAMVYLDTDKFIDVAAGWSASAASGNMTNVISFSMAQPKLNTVVARFAADVKESAFTAAALGEGYSLKVLDKTLVIATEENAMVAYYNNVGYATLEEAFEALPVAGESTVYLVNDALVSATITLKPGQSVTLSTASDPAVENQQYTQRTIKRAEGFLDLIFSVEKDSKLSLGAPLTKKLVIDGEGREVNTSAISVNGKLDIGVGASVINNNNKATQQIGEKVFTCGGGVSVFEGAELLLSGGSISGCYASYGGAVYVNNGKFILSNGVISENKALYGGGVYLMTVPKPDEEQSQNNAAAEAGEKESVSALLEMGDGRIEKNTAVTEASLAYSGMGGGVYVGNGSCFDISGGKLVDNIGPKGSAVSVGDVPTDKDATVINPRFTVSKKAFISSKNTIYLAVSGVSYINVIPGLTEQKNEPMTISLPALMPQNMPLVKYIKADVTDENAQKPAEQETSEDESKLSVLSAIENGLFKLDEAAAKNFVLFAAPNDPTVIINTKEDGSFAGLLTGEHYNGITRYEEIEQSEMEETKETTEEKTDSSEEEKAVQEEAKLVQLNYKPVTLNTKGIFTAHFSMSYDPALYGKVDAMLTAPFVKGTYITMVDYSDLEAVSYYYYRVSGEEDIIEEGSDTEFKDEEGNILKTPGLIEIPLTSFVKLGTTDQYYELVFDAESKKVTEQMLFTVKLSGAELPEGISPYGDFVMEWNHYIKGEIEGVRYDISYGMNSPYTISAPQVSEEGETISSSKVYLGVEDNVVTLSYTLDDNSNAVAENCGVILINLNGRFPKGTVFTDDNGGVYLAGTRSSGVAIAIPKDSMGNLIKSAEIRLTATNYYGSNIAMTEMTAFVYASEDSKHYNTVFEADAAAESVKFSLAAKDKYDVLVTTPDGSEKPFYDGYSELSSNDFLEMKVKGVYNSKEIGSFTLFLQRKTEDGYENCALSELFKIDDPEVKQVILDTGDVNLELRSSLLSVKGEEFKVGFKVGDAVEFIKVNVTDDR